MLNIEMIQLEAQDVIASSVAAPENAVVDPCTNSSGHNAVVTISNGTMKFVCSHCGVEVSSSGTIIGG